MRILFISSGNNTLNEPGIVVKNQADSLAEKGVKVDFFLIRGKGIAGYLRNSPALVKRLRNNRYDVVHAHYADSAALASLVVLRPLVVSLMGSDAFVTGFQKLLLYFFARRWKTVIVKSEAMQIASGIKRAIVLPNGVDLRRFPDTEKLAAKRELNWDQNKKHILFLADKTRLEKNYKLAEDAVKIFNNEGIELKAVHNVPNNKTYLYFYACDIVLMTSLHEGSPNVIKEAMVCGSPIVSTEVGDVKKLIEPLDGCYIAAHNATSVSDCLVKAIQFEGKTKGRDRILDLELDADSVAKKLIEIYKTVSN